MKTLKNFWYIAVLLLFFTPILTSCGDDDGSISLGTPKYESVSGKYNITSPGSQYRSIELGSSGNYIVITGSSYYAQQARSGQKKSSFFYQDKTDASRATNYNGIIYGTYTQLADGSFDLEGFGIVKIIYAEDKTVTGIELTPETGGPVTLTVEKEEVMADDDMTNALCRTWRMDKLEINLTEGDQSFSATVTRDNWQDYEIMETFGDEVLFSKSGTYMVTYVDGAIGISSWKWKNKDAGTIFYSWDNQWYEDEFVTLSFSGNTLIIHEVYEEDDYEYYKEETYTYLVAE